MSMSNACHAEASELGLRLQDTCLRRVRRLVEADFLFISHGHEPIGGTPSVKVFEFM